jgi:hypothetical protein
MLPGSGHRCRNPVSPDSNDQIGRIPARTAGFLPAGWICPDGLDSGRLAGSGQSGRPDLARKSRPERPDPCRLAITTGFQQFWQISASMPESDRFVSDSGSFGLNPANLDSDETVQIPAFILDSGYSNHNLVKVARILSIIDGI